MFKAIVIEKNDAGYHANVKDVEDSALPDGDVTIRIDYSTINYKDGLVITGKSPVVRKFPLHAGIDFAGTVESSNDSRYSSGDKVLLNGWGVGESHSGGLAQKADAGWHEQQASHGDWHCRLYSHVVRSCTGTTWSQE
jgi:acrylyl-CoA reductase (NADPH)